MRPQIGTEPVGGQSQVVIQTDAQAPIDGVLAGRRRVADRAAIGCIGRTERCASVFARIRAWPLTQDPGIAPANRSSSRCPGSACESHDPAPNDREAMQQIAFAFDILLELGARGVSSLHSLRNALKSNLQETKLQCVYALVFHQFGRAQGGDLLLHRCRLEQLPGSSRRTEIGNGFDIKIDGIAIEDGVGKIRAGVVGLAIGDRMQRD